METNKTLVSFSKYIIRKTNEEVEVVAFHQPNDGARTEPNPQLFEDGDWVTYIDSKGNEHIREQLNIQLDFKTKNEDIFQNLINTYKTSKLPNTRNTRIYDIARELILNHDCNMDQAIDTATIFVDKVGIETD